jgi:acetyl-CoA acyltransferase
MTNYRKMADIFIAGVAMTPFAKRPAVSIKQLTTEATSAVLADAGAASNQIEVAFFSNGFQGFVEGQTNIPGQIALRAAGIDSIPIVNVENACASATTALWLALQYLRSGAGDIALAVGAEKLHYGDADLDARVVEAFKGGMDIHDLPATMERIALHGVPPPSEELGRRTKFMDLYSAMCRAHMKRLGSTQRQMAAIAAKNHAHSVHNPNAQFRRTFTLEEILAARSVGFPLTVPMCSPLSDGAAAAILCTARGAERLGLPGLRVRVLASEITSGSDRPWDEVERGGVCRAAKKAYEVAGVGPKDLDVAEVHDATAWGELHVTEKLGLCAFGEGGILAESGATAIGGRIPVNPSGGLESRGHPIAATGLAQIFELTTQLRGQAGARQVEGARIGLQENGGGFLGVEEGVAAVTILERCGA